MNKPRFAVFLALLLISVAACNPATPAAPAAQNVPTGTATVFEQVTPTATFTATSTRTPTVTPSPSSTPTSTLTPTATFTPGPTPLGGGSGQISYHFLDLNDKFGKAPYWWDSESIELIDVTGDNARTIVQGDSSEMTLHSYRWSTDGRYLYYVYKQKICKIDIKDPSLKPECLPANAELIIEVAPDGHQVLYRANSEYCTIVDVKTGKSTRTFNESWMYECGRWAPNGEQIVYTAETNEQTHSKKAIFLLDVRTKEKSKLTEAQSFNPKWSPDGKFISYLRWVGDFSEIFLISPEGGPPQELTFQNSTIHDHYWSPDSRKVAYLLPHSYHMCLSQIDVIDVDTGKWQSIKTNNVCGGISWSPDGSHLAFCADPDRDKKYSIYVAGLDKQEPTMIQGDLEMCGHVLWRP